MKTTSFLTYLLQQIPVLVLVFATPNVASTQSTIATGNTKEGGQASLQGITESVLIDGQPALKILSRKSGSTEIKRQQRDGEDSLVFEVVKFRVGEGKLFVTRSKIIFDPHENKSGYFRFSKTDIKEIKIGKGNLTIKTEGGIDWIIPHFSEGIDKSKSDDLLPVSNFISKAIKQFDSALNEFEQLTANLRSKPEEDEEEKIDDDTKASVDAKYDRFKDITIVSTAKMFVRGSKRSIRAFAEYTFKGKAQKKPESVWLYFYASAARPLFREDNLELNFLIDGRRFRLGELRLTDEEKTKTATKQTVAISMPYETFAQIANGKKVEFQIGTREYKLPDVHLEAFRKLLTYKIEE